MQSPKQLAINGFGRIGRCVLRAYLERPALHSQLSICAINEIADTQTLLHLLKYDSTHGRLPAEVSCEIDAGREYLVLQDAWGGRQRIALSHQSNLAELKWERCDVLLECTGLHGSRVEAEQLLSAGAQKVLYSQPASPEVDNTVVFGVNEKTLKPNDKIISNASCTTNALVPVVKTLHEAFGISAGAITTLHSAMNDQPVIDAYHHTDLRKTRAAISSMIPVHTALARGVERILPELKDCFTAHAIRVPTINVSAIDLTLNLKQNVDVAAINTCLAEASEQDLAGIMAITDEKLASCDFNHDPHSVIVDASQTQVTQGSMVKLLLWFDNEWAYANRMLDVAALL